MKSKKLSNKILRLIKSKGFNNIELDPVLETKFILQRSGENFKTEEIVRSGLRHNSLPFRS